MAVEIIIVVKIVQWTFAPDSDSLLEGSYTYESLAFKDMIGLDR